MILLRNFMIILRNFMILLRNSPHTGDEGHRDGACRAAGGQGQGRGCRSGGRQEGFVSWSDASAAVPACLPCLELCCRCHAWRPGVHRSGASWGWQGLSTEPVWSLAPTHLQMCNHSREEEECQRGLEGRYGRARRLHLRRCRWDQVLCEHASRALLLLRAVCGAKSWVTVALVDVCVVCIIQATVTISTSCKLPRELQYWERVLTTRPDKSQCRCPKSTAAAGRRRQPAFRRAGS